MVPYFKGGPRDFGIDFKKRADKKFRLKRGPKI